MNKWNIPAQMESAIRLRDTKCVYCSASFTDRSESIKTSATWEHIINDLSIVTLENIVLCCFSCNSSKGAKPLSEWLESAYCKRKKITGESVADVVRLHL